MDAWIRKFSNAYALYNKLFGANVSSDEDEQGALIDDNITIQVDPTQDTFHEESSRTKENRPSGENIQLSNRCLQINFERAHQELSQINTERLVQSVVDIPGGSNEPDIWLQNCGGCPKL